MNDAAPAAEPPRKTAVFLMALGGPDSLDNVEPYLLDLRGGRPTSPEMVEEIRERYRMPSKRSENCLAVDLSLESV